MQSIQVLGPGCPECRQLKADVETALRRQGLAVAVEHVTEISRIIAMDALLTPALAIDGKVCLVGRHQSVEQIEEILQRYSGGERLSENLPSPGGRGAGAEGR